MSVSRPRRPSLGRGLLVGLLLGALLTGLAVLLTLSAFLRHRGDWPLEGALAAVAKELAIPRSASDLKPPGPLDDRRLLAAGREAYTGSCALCHGAAGDGKGAFGTALYPDATPLRLRDVQAQSDGRLFWIIKNGLSFGGMPAFGDQYSDDGIWALVAYTRALANGGSTLAPLAIATPTGHEIAFADPSSSEAAARGAAIYLEQGCQYCHGARGVAPGDLAIAQGRPGTRSLDELAKAMREPPRGMPAYGATQLDDRELPDLLAYLQTFPPSQRGERRGA